MGNPERLVKWRKRQEWSQEEAAQRFGVPQGTWAPWETGKKTPSLKNASNLEIFTEGEVKATGWLQKDRRYFLRTGTNG